MTQSLDFWSFSGRVGRGRYAVVGFLAFTVKHNLDRLLAQPHKVPWSPFIVSLVPVDISYASDLVNTLDVDILPYVIFLIVPVMGRMSDSDNDIRLLSTETFATLVKLVPLEVIMSY